MSAMKKEFREIIQSFLTGDSACSTRDTTRKGFAESVVVNIIGSITGYLRRNRSRENIVVDGPVLFCLGMR